jgi:pyruvate dehydrogenase E1 component
MASGAIMTEALEAGELLSQQGYSVSIYSVTSWSELSRDKTGFVGTLLSDSTGPIVAVSDYVKALPESIRAQIPHNRRYVTLGTDGFGRSDTRAALRSFFGVNAQGIVNAALSCT